MCDGETSAKEYAMAKHRLKEYVMANHRLKDNKKSHGKDGKTSAKRWPGNMAKMAKHQ